MENAYAVILRELWTPTQEMLQHLWLIVEARTSGVTSHLIPWPPPDSKIRVLQLCFRYLLVCPSWQKVQDGVTVWWYDINLINTAIPAEEKHLPLYYELASKINVEYIAGGATQNSIRVAQWMLQISGATSYRKCIRKDKCGEEMKKNAQAAEVPAHYYTDEIAPTGTGNGALVEKLVVEHAIENGELFQMSLSAPFVCKRMRIAAITQGVDPVVVAETKVMLIGGFLSQLKGDMLKVWRGLRASGISSGGECHVLGGGP